MTRGTIGRGGQRVGSRGGVRGFVGAAPSVLSLATWRVTAANYSGTGNWLDEIGSVDAALPGSGSDPTWDGANSEWDYAQVVSTSVDYHTMGNASVLDPGAGSFSAVFRVKVGNVTERNHFAAKKADTSTAAGWLVEVAGDIASDPFRVMVADGTSAVLVLVNGVTAGTYHTFGFSYVAGGACTPYLNGSAGTPVSVAALGSLANAQNAVLGHRSDLVNTGLGLNGSLRAGVFYKGRALTAAQHASAHTELVALEP